MPLPDKFVRERYLSPSGKYAVEIVGEFQYEVYLHDIFSNKRYLIASLGFPVQGCPLFFEDDRILVFHTGSCSSGTWPMVFIRTGETNFSQVHEFDLRLAFDALKLFSKVDANFGPVHLYMEVTGFRESDFFELSLRGDGTLKHHRYVLKPVALDYSFNAKRFADTNRPVPPNRYGPRMVFESLTGYGTGFFIDKRGLILTCYYVVDGANSIKILMSTGETRPAGIVDKDCGHDLALLRVNVEAPAVVPMAYDENPDLGDEIYTLGFPVPFLEGFNPKVTAGIINSLTGMEDDSDALQISAQTSPGNSGGAVVSEKGILVGVVSSTVTPEFFREQTGVFPQNVNYATKSSLARPLLERQSASPETAAFQTTKLAIQNLKKATVLILTYGFPETERVPHSVPTDTA
jgi:S1-C subfamily serine protease